MVVPKLYWVLIYYISHYKKCFTGIISSWFHHKPIRYHFYGHMASEELRALEPWGINLEPPHLAFFHTASSSEQFLSMRPYLSTYSLMYVTACIPICQQQLSKPVPVTHVNPFICPQSSRNQKSFVLPCSLSFLVKCVSPNNIGIIIKHRSQC